jgi:cytochrome c553
MKNRLLAFSLTLAFASTPSLLYADGMVSAGKEKASSCGSCHGVDGNSMVGTFPKLAQQHESYLIKQLKNFKDGTRKDAMMSAMAMSLSDEDMADIAAYYADEKIAPNQLPVADSDDEDIQAATKGEEAVEALIKQGSDLYRNGDLGREVSACIACHGPQGEGNKPAGFPVLKSQHADYLIKALSDFKSGARSNNPENVMHMIAKKMTLEEIKAVSYRISMMK